MEIYPLTADGERQSFEKAALVEGIEAEEETIEMEYGDDPVKLGYRILPENSAEKAVRFLSENPDVATVDTDGYLHALKEGTTVIQMITKDGGFYRGDGSTGDKDDSGNRGVTLNVNDAALSVGEKLYLEAGYYPAEAENLGFKWSSSDTSVAIVNNGTVTAMGEGECVISVRDYYGNFKAECKVVVGTKKSESEGGCKSNLSGISAGSRGDARGGRILVNSKEEQKWVRKRRHAPLLQFWLLPAKAAGRTGPRKTAAEIISGQT